MKRRWEGWGVKAENLLWKWGCEDDTNRGLGVRRNILYKQARWFYWNLKPAIIIPRYCLVCLSHYFQIHICLSLWFPFVSTLIQLQLFINSCKLISRAQGSEIKSIVVQKRILDRQKCLADLGEMGVPDEGIRIKGTCTGRDKGKGKMSSRWRKERRKKESNIRGNWQNDEAAEEKLRQNRYCDSEPEWG